MAGNEKRAKRDSHRKTKVRTKFNSEKAGKLKRCLTKKKEKPCSIRYGLEIPVKKSRLAIGRLCTVSRSKNSLTKKHINTSSNPFALLSLLPISRRCGTDKTLAYENKNQQC